MSSKRRMKHEPEEEAAPSPSTSKKTKKGEKPTPDLAATVLNKRGMPQRIRKKNRLYENDDIVTPTKQSPKKATAVTPATPKPTPPSTPKVTTPKIAMKSTPKVVPTPPVASTSKDKEEVKEKEKEPPKKKETKPQSEKKVKGVSILTSDTFVAPDKKIAQKIGVRLRNLLKLPKAHKWVCYEWFYSNLDRPLFQGDNDFMTCLKESFPQLKTRKLTRVEWCKIRRMMGKPRRCSPSFFEEERRELERKRTKIRALQQRKASTDMSMFKELPDEIPLQLSIGTKVTARLRRPQDGLFSGSIDAVDTSNNTYRITFDRQGLGTHSIPDYEVLSNDNPEMISVASIAARMRPRSYSSLPSEMTSRLKMDNTPSLLPPKFKPQHAESTGGFPVKLLETIVRLQKILKIKQFRVSSLREMNSEAERRVSMGIPFPPDFVRRYAISVLELDRLNVALSDLLNAMQENCGDGLSVDDTVGSAVAVAPSTLRQLSEEEARVVVIRQNEAKQNHMVKSDRAVHLISSLTSIMLQLKGLVLAEGDNAFELQVLQETVDKVRQMLHPSSLKIFRECVEDPLDKIQLGMGHRGMLAPFLTQRA
ncbi:protein lin-9 homolog [Neocloeon triangulifer]|uniref:protein lin-9 homolog n=1 Tax=Neocloeon triangulifer TaxID=2078957 RepID=UPI00286ECFB5|nr:protein lin-9 homolog [Neocloeon triangulifer]XP_059490620.1 protein lin-9 homolog [Neocloeon triangulifer]